MKQFTLDNWLNIKKTDYNIKQYFYINWESRFVPKNAVWLDKRPKKINFIETVKWNKINKNYSFFICGYFPDIDSKYSIKKEIKYKNIYYLKSHLQKAIRRKEDTLAVQSARHMIKNDIIAFLRRLPIITIEDTFLIDTFSTLIWIMVACSSTKFKIKKYILEWLLGYVCTLSTLSIKDSFKNIETDNNSLSAKLHNYYNLEDNHISVLYSLHLRKAYGGMNCDIKLLDRAINNWHHRFINKKVPKIFSTEIKPISFDVEPLSLDNWILAAIDFHCYPNILKMLNKKYPKLNVTELRKLIWHNSSKINKRKENSKYNYSSFLKIKDDLKYLQIYLLNCYF